MILSYRSKALQLFAQKGNASKLSVQNPARITVILTALDSATQIDQMAVPGFKFHALKGKDKGRFSVWVNGNYRITFGWNGTDVIDVDLEDYH